MSFVPSYVKTAGKWVLSGINHAVEALVTVCFVALVIAMVGFLIHAAANFFMLGWNWL